jgi:hypothetical protein
MMGAEFANGVEMRGVLMQREIAQEPKPPQLNQKQVGSIVSISNHV